MLRAGTWELRGSSWCKGAQCPLTPLQAAAAPPLPPSLDPAEGKDHPFLASKRPEFTSMLHHCCVTLQGASLLGLSFPNLSDGHSSLPRLLTGSGCQLRETMCFVNKKSVSSQPMPPPQPSPELDTTCRHLSLETLAAPQKIKVFGQDLKIGILQKILNLLLHLTTLVHSPKQQSGPHCLLHAPGCPQHLGQRLGAICHVACFPPYTSHLAPLGA